MMVSLVQVIGLGLCVTDYGLRITGFVCGCLVAGSAGQAAY